MSQFQCQTCGGTYADVQLDGSLYFHACPPIFDPTHPTVVTPMPNARNENLTIGRDWKASGIVSAGAGTKPVKAQASPDPAWLTKLQADLAKEE